MLKYLIFWEKKKKENEKEERKKLPLQVSLNNFSDVCEFLLKLHSINKLFSPLIDFDLMKSF